VSPGRRRALVGGAAAGGALLFAGAAALPRRPREAIPAAGAPLPEAAPDARGAAPGEANAASGPKQRGVALGLFAEDVSFDYRPLLREIAGLGATHVALVVPLYQEHGASTTLRLHTRLSPSLDATAEAVRGARGAGLEVTLFPIVRLSAPKPGEWRGTLAPADPDAWFGSYEALLGTLAGIGTLTGATRLVVGSELSTLDVDVPRWSRLLEKIRALFRGPLLYSANWDHYKDAKLLDLVDEAGVTAYFELRAKEGAQAAALPDVVPLERRWRELRAEIERWQAGRKPQPFVFTEVGYRSRAGASATPWDETPGGAVALEEQRRAFEAFRRAWRGAPALAGVYVWNWYGFGGPTSIGYTPRGKPAAAEVARLLREL
jgi:hypothetical protein